MLLLLPLWLLLLDGGGVAAGGMPHALHLLCHGEGWVCAQPQAA
jgi:hypothetical protein